MSKRELFRKYRAWRKEHNNQKPNRVYVKMYWKGEYEDIENWHYDVLGIENMNNLNFVDDERVLFYVHSLGNLFQLMEQGNGSDFVVIDVIGFDKVYKEFSDAIDYVML